MIYERLGLAQLSVFLQVSAPSLLPHRAFCAAEAGAALPRLSFACRPGRSRALCPAHCLRRPLPAPSSELLRKCFAESSVFSAGMGTPRPMPEGAGDKVGDRREGHRH
jgi:hypothetical protein